MLSLTIGFVGYALLVPIPGKAIIYGAEGIPGAGGGILEAPGGGIIPGRGGYGIPGAGGGGLIPNAGGGGIVPGIGG